MAQPRVLIVGASIAGPMTAYWLHKAGCQITIIERFPSFRRGGQNIDIRTAGVAVMRRIPGMESLVRSKTTTLSGISFVREDGSSYGTIGSTGNADQQSLVSEYEIFRDDLSEILVDLTRRLEGVEYIFGEQVRGIQQGEDGVAVEFQGDTPPGKFDLVVACDGATSRTREIGLGCARREFVNAVNTWAAYFSLEKDLLSGSTVAQARSIAPGKFIGIGPDPKGGCRATLMGIYPRNSEKSMDGFREAQKKGTEELKNFVAQRFRGTGWKADELVEGLMESDDFYASEWVQVKTPALYKGRFTMVGDAGYAPGPTGGGTTLAMAGAYILAGEVCKNKGNLTAALEGYEKQMRPLITEMQKVPPGVPGIMAPQSAWLIWVRNQIFAFVAWSGIVNVMQKYFAGAFASTDKFPLPEYDWEK